MKKNKLILGILGMILLIAGSSFLYNNLKEREADQLSQLAQKTMDEAKNEQDQVTGNEDSTQEENPDMTDFIVYDSEGNKVRLSDFVGKPIVLNFWASWCGPCKAEMPEFEKMYQEKKDEIHFLMVNMTDGNQETRKSAKEYVEDEGYTFPVYFDSDLNAAMAYQVYSIPTTYFFDENGSMVTYALGSLSKENLQKGIDLITTK